MPMIYLNLNFDSKLFAIEPADRKELKTAESKTLDCFILEYSGTGEARLANYEIYIYPDEFLKGSEFGLEISPIPKAWANGIVKIKTKQDLYEYLLIDKKPQFSLVRVMISPFLELFPKKSEASTKISCEWSKKKPS